MDCEALKTDIENLQAKHNALQEQIELLSDADSGEVKKKSEIQAMQADIESTVDSLLGKYLDDFAEQNPDVFLPFEVGEVERLPYETEVTKIMPLPDIPGKNGRILVGGKKSPAYLLEQNPSGESYDYLGEVTHSRSCTLSSAVVLPNNEGVLFGLVDTPTVNGVAPFRTYLLPLVGNKPLSALPLQNDVDVYSLAIVPNSSDVLMGGGLNGYLSICYKGNPDPNTGRRRFIKGFGHKINEDIGYINAIQALPNSEDVLIASSLGYLGTTKRNQDGTYKSCQKIINAPNLYRNVFLNIVTTPDNDDALVGNALGDFYIIKKTKDGAWEFDERRKIETNLQPPSTAVLPNGDVIVANHTSEFAEKSFPNRHHGKIGIITKNDTGDYKFISYGGVVKFAISTIAALPNGDILLGGSKGQLCTLYRKENPKTVEELKRNLDKIIEKGSL